MRDGQLFRYRASMRSPGNFQSFILSDKKLIELELVRNHLFLLNSLFNTFFVLTGCWLLVFFHFNFSISPSWIFNYLSNSHLSMSHFFSSSRYLFSHFFTMNNKYYIVSLYMLAAWVSNPSLELLASFKNSLILFSSMSKFSEKDFRSLLCI